MKKQIVILMLLLSVIGLKAQNYIIYTEYHPDTCFTFESTEDVYILDINQDGNPDVYFDAYFHSGFGLIICLHVEENWEYAYRLNGNTPLGENEIINDSLPWYHGVAELARYPECTRFAFRHHTGHGYYYGWAHIVLESLRVVCISSMGYCTLPNEPIQWGQTELVGIEEATSTPFATLHPNPTNGLVTITGENLRQAEVINMLGQQVLSVQGQDNELHVDMAALPAGVYFVNVTDEEGRKCVRKVVKE